MQKLVMGLVENNIKKLHLMQRSVDPIDKALRKHEEGKRTEDSERRAVLVDVEVNKGFLVENHHVAKSVQDCIAKARIERPKDLFALEVPVRLELGKELLTFENKKVIIV
jgi:uncharacterized protein related to proFAR isomerase